MTVMVEIDMPMPRDLIEALGNEMGVHAHAPDGLVSHVLAETPDGVHVVDIWDSQEMFERFRDNQLVPEMMKMLQARGITPPAELPEARYTPVYDLVRGS
ncbi:MAG: hypothetical protein ACTHJ6_09100 [Oryzihumus sp.]